MGGGQTGSQSGSEAVIDADLIKKIFETSNTQSADQFPQDDLPFTSDAQSLTVQQKMQLNFSVSALIKTYNDSFLDARLKVHEGRASLIADQCI